MMNARVLASLLVALCVSLLATTHAAPVQLTEEDQELLLQVLRKANIVLDRMLGTTSDLAPSNQQDDSTNLEDFEVQLNQRYNPDLVGEESEDMEKRKWVYNGTKWVWVKPTHGKYQSVKRPARELGNSQQLDEGASGDVAGSDLEEVKGETLLPSDLAVDDPDELEKRGWVWDRRRTKWVWVPVRPERTVEELELDDGRLPYAQREADSGNSDDEVSLKEAIEWLRELRDARKTRQ